MIKKIKIFLLISSMIITKITKLTKDDLELEKSKIEMLESRKLVEIAKTSLDKLEKEFFNKKDLSEIYLNIFGSTNSKEIREIKKQMKKMEKGQELSNENKQKMIMKKNINDYFKQKNQHQFTRNQVLENIQKKKFLNYLEDKIEEEETENFVVRDQDRKLLEENLNSYYHYY